MIHKGQLLRLLRESLDITQDEAAKKAGISPGYLSHIEHGKKEPANSVLLHLADLYRIPATLLYWNEDDLNRTTNPAEKKLLKTVEDVMQQLFFLVINRKK